MQCNAIHTHIDICSHVYSVLKYLKIAQEYVYSSYGGVRKKNAFLSTFCG